MPNRDLSTLNLAQCEGYLFALQDEEIWHVALARDTTRMLENAARPPISPASRLNLERIRGFHLATATRLRQQMAEVRAAAPELPSDAFAAAPA